MKMKMKIGSWISVGLVIGILLLGLAWYFYQPRFLSTSELYDLLSRNSDGYYNGFNANDLRVRGVKNAKEYTEKIRSSCSEFTPEEKKRLLSSVKEVREKLEGYRISKIEGMDVAKLSRIPLIFGCTVGKDYEGALPHTRYPAIIINRREFSMSQDVLNRLVLHELTHLYQKIYPEDVRRYLREKGVQVVGKRRLEDNIRSNPDLDGLIYKNMVTGETYEFTYKDSPSSIGDVSTRGQGGVGEHPFEEIAYKTESLANDFPSC